MRFAHVFTVLLSIGALVLSLLALFAGTNNGFLGGDPLMTVSQSQPSSNHLLILMQMNISRIGHSLKNDSSNRNDSACDPDAYGLIMFNDTTCSSNDTSAAEVLGLPDFYKVYAMNFCEGYFELEEGQISESENVTGCSSSQAGFGFDLAEVVASSLPSGVSLSDLDFPRQVIDDKNFINSTSDAFFFFLIAGVIFIMLSILTGFWGMFSKRDLSNVMGITITVVSRRQEQTLSRMLTRETHRLAPSLASGLPSVLCHSKEE